MSQRWIQDGCIWWTDQSIPLTKDLTVSNIQAMHTYARMHTGQRLEEEHWHMEVGYTHERVATAKHGVLQDELLGAAKGFLP